MRQSQSLITRIVVAHRPDTTALADRVVLIDGGQIVADERRRPYQVETSKEALRG